MSNGPDAPVPSEGDRYVLALTFNHGDRLVGEKTFASLSDAVEWARHTEVLDVFDGDAWAVVDTVDGRIVGSLADLWEWMAGDEPERRDTVVDFDEERAADAFKAMTSEKSELPPTHFCGGLILFPTWKKVKRRALVGQCEICRKPVVIRFE